MIGRTLQLSHPDIKGNPSTSITAAASSASSSITVANTNHMTSDEYVVIGAVGSQTAELILVGTISTDTALPLATNTDFFHSAGESVQHIYYNQIEIGYSSNLDTLWDAGTYASLYDAMSAATWTTLATVDIKVSQPHTTYQDFESGRSYRARYKNSDETKYSDYFLILLPNGYEEKSVAAIKRKGLSILNKKIATGDVGQVNDEFCYDSINECLRLIASSRKRWSHDASFEGVISEITPGLNEYIIPTSIEVRDTKRSIWNLKIADGANLSYIDKREMDLLQQDVHYSQLAVQLTSASTTATFDDTSNFDDSGTFDIWTGTTHNTVTYTANNRTTNVLTLSDAATEVTTTHAVDTFGWQNASFGVPKFYTVINKKIVFDVVPDETMYKRNIEGDYYLKAQQIDSDDDYVRVQDPNIVINFLRMQIALKTNNDTKYGQFRQMFIEQLDTLKRLESTGQTQKLIPNGWRYRTIYRTRTESQNNDK